MVAADHKRPPPHTSSLKSKAPLCERGTPAMSATVLTSFCKAGGSYSLHTDRSEYILRATCVTSLTLRPLLHQTQLVKPIAAGKVNLRITKEGGKEVDGKGDITELMTLLSKDAALPE